MRGISCRPTPGRRYATWQAQIVTTLGVVLYNGLQNLLLQRYILFYAPPNRMGMSRRLPLLQQ